jgi:hypothetical protein
VSIPIAPVAASCLALFVGCGPPPQGAAPSSVPSVIPPLAAADIIAQSRCAHENACGGVGADRPFATEAACKDELQRSAETDLSRKPCVSGLDPDRVGACASALRDESCHPLSTLSRMYACRVASLCRNLDTETFTTEDAYR